MNLSLEHLPKQQSLEIKGFTLLELLVVILIIGLLTGIVAPRYAAQVSRSEAATARAQMDSLDKALEAYRMDAGHYPTTVQGLSALVTQPPGEDRWRGPYLKDNVPLDPWGMPYQYIVPGANGKDFQLMSYGSDKAPGGTGDAADIIK